MLLIDASEIERLAKIGDIASAKAKPDSGLAFLGTIMVDPGRISGPPKPKNEVAGTEIPFGSKTYVLSGSA